MTTTTTTTPTNWTGLIEALPPPATRVLVKTLDGPILIGKLTIFGWIDDNTIPIRNVQGWMLLP